MVSELTLKRPKIHDIPSKGIKIKAALIQDLKRKIYMIIQQASDTFHNQPFKNAVRSLPRLRMRSLTGQFYEIA